MCGRYAVTLPPEAVRAFFGYVEQPNFPPRFNIAPTQPIAVVQRDRTADPSNDRHFGLVRWGFVPTFVKDFAAFRPFVNARSEELTDKPSFRNAFRRRRCLVIADGFYEWRKGPVSPSQPFLLRRPDGSPFGMAGLTETWSGADGSEIETACIITTAANESLSQIHPRMPVIIDPQDFDLWLDPDERSLPDAAMLMRPAPEDLLSIFAVGPAINKVANDDASVQEVLPETAVAEASRPADKSEAQGSLF